MTTSPRVPPAFTVSVVVPCYNHERYVAECLRSIDSQDLEQLEVIVIDDGSKDRTWEAIEAFKFSPERQVRRIRSINRGAHAQLNHGLQLARGEWIALCNSDDLFPQRRLSTLLDWTGRANARFAFSRVRFVDNSGRDVTDSLDYARALKRRQDEVAGFPSVGWALMPSNVAISTGNFFFQRSLVSELGFFRPYKLVHDWDYILRAVLLTEPLMVPAPLYDYRIHAHNSFASLMGEVAAKECPELMRRYWKAAAYGRPKNPLAPCFRNWPGYCDVFLDDWHYGQYLQRWNEVDAPYYPAPSPPPVDAPVAQGLSAAE